MADLIREMAQTGLGSEFDSYQLHFPEEKLNVKRTFLNLVNTGNFSSIFHGQVFSLISFRSLLRKNQLRRGKFVENDTCDFRGIFLDKLDFPRQVGFSFS